MHMFRVYILPALMHSCSIIRAASIFFKFCCVESFDKDIAQPVMKYMAAAAQAAHRKNPSASAKLDPVVLCDIASGLFAVWRPVPYGDCDRHSLLTAIDQNIAHVLECCNSFDIFILTWYKTA